jgi:hypothetical protein
MNPETKGKKHQTQESTITTMNPETNGKKHQTQHVQVTTSKKADSTSEVNI